MNAAASFTFSPERVIIFHSQRDCDKPGDIHGQRTVNACPVSLFHQLTCLRDLSKYAAPERVSVLIGRLTFKNGMNFWFVLTVLLLHTVTTRSMCYCPHDNDGKQLAAEWLWGQLFNFHMLLEQIFISGPLKNENNELVVPKRTHFISDIQVCDHLNINA